MLAEPGLKLPPFSLEAEASVIGGIFLSKEAIHEISFLKPDDFYRKDHQIIFTAILDLVSKNEACDLVTVAECLENRHQLEDVGGMIRLGSIAENTPSASNIKAYAEIVRKRSMLRALIQTTQDINDLAFNPDGKDATEVVDYAASKIYNLADERIESNIKTARDITNSWLEKLDYRYNHPGEILGLKTGFSDLDHRLNGLEGGDLVIIAGRPSMGKTAFAVNIGENLAIKDNKSVAIFSLEMPSDQLIQRTTSSLSHVAYHKLKTGRIEADDWPKVTKAAGQIAQSSLHIDDTAGLTAMQVRSTARKIQRKHGLDLIIIDYLQLMTHPKADRHDLAIAETTKMLKNMAKEFNIPIILLSQLNRGLEQRQDKRPTMGDLRDSGAIEQDADVIMFVYRDEVYNTNSEDKGIAEIITRKQRNGETGTDKLTFIGQNMRFEDHFDQGRD